MTPSRHRVLDEGARVLLSVFFGFVVTAFLSVCLLLLDEALFDSNSNLDLEGRLPAWWVLTWPSYLWSHVWGTGNAVLVSTALTHVCIFSAVSYAVVRSNSPRPLR